jgi:hypothetical protein
MRMCVLDVFAGCKELSLRELHETAVFYTQTRAIPGIKVHVLKCTGCGVTYYPHPVKHGQVFLGLHA